MLTPTIQLAGVDYVSTREIERAYSLSRKRAWQLLKDSNLQRTKFLQMNFYLLTDAQTYMNEKLKNN